MKRLLCLAMLGAMMTTPAIAAPLKLEPAQSAVSAVFKQMNVPVEGKFSKYAAQIDFDSTKLAQSKARLDVDIASFDLGDPDYNRETQKPEWFDGTKYPKATFISESITAAGPGKFDVTGKLTLKGKVANVRFPLSVKESGTTRVFEGALPIRRLAYQIGADEWKDTSIIADEVVIKFRLTTKP